jgi:mono/diheme cytochrome c family protein
MKRNEKTRPVRRSGTTMLQRTFTIAVAAAALLGSTSACKNPDELAWSEKKITQDYTFAGGVTASASDLDKGRVAYINNCYACHGMDGDGKGPASHGFRPPPRDFRTGDFKFGAVRSGELPSDEDLMRIVKGGLHGTPMLPWDVPDQQLQNIIQFIKTFPPPACDPEKEGAEKCAKDAEKYPEGKPNKWMTTYTRGKKKGQPKPTGDPVVVPTEDPWAGKVDQAVAKGAELYHLKAQCANCHPSYLTRQELSDLKTKVDGKPMTGFRDNMYRSIVLLAKDNPYKVNLMPPDFTVNPIRSVRKGTEMHDMWRLIASGVGGVMPAWVDGLKADEIWAISYYVKSLADLRDTVNIGARRALWAKLKSQPAWKPPPPPEPDPKKYVLKIEDGKMTLGEDEIEDDEALTQKLKELLESSPVELVIQSDGSLDEDRVKELNLLAEAIGVKKVVFEGADAKDGDDAKDADKKDGDEKKGDKGKPAVPIPTDGDIKGDKGKTKVPPTPTPPVPRPKAPGKPPPPSDPYD